MHGHARIPTPCSGGASMQRRRRESFFHALSPRAAASNAASNRSARRLQPFSQRGAPIRGLAPQIDQNRNVSDKLTVKTAEHDIEGSEVLESMGAAYGQVEGGLAVHLELTAAWQQWMQRHMRS